MEQTNPQPVPEIHFDRRTLAILRYIHRSKDKGVTWAQLERKFGDDANIFLLESFDKALYTVTQDENGEWITMDGPKGKAYKGSFRSFCTPKGNELLEKRSFDFWKWIIPIFISTAALIVSCISAWFSINAKLSERAQQLPSPEPVEIAQEPLLPVPSLDAAEAPD